MYGASSTQIDKPDLDGNNEREVHLLEALEPKDPLQDRNNIPYYEVVTKLLKEIDLIKNRNQRIDDEQKEKVTSKPGSSNV